jgi:hypothetical protein
MVIGFDVEVILFVALGVELMLLMDEEVVAG